MAQGKHQLFQLPLLPGCAPIFSSTYDNQGTRGQNRLQALLPIAAEIKLKAYLFGINARFGNHSKLQPLEKINRHRRTIQREVERNYFDHHQRNPKAQVPGQIVGSLQGCDRSFLGGIDNRHSQAMVRVRVIRIKTFAAGMLRLNFFKPLIVH